MKRALAVIPHIAAEDPILELIEDKRKQIQFLRERKERAVFAFLVEEEESNEFV